MKIKAKKLLKILIIVSLVVVFLFTSTLNFNNKVEALNKNMLEKDLIIEQLNDSIREQQNLNDETIKETEKINEEYEKLKENYKELEQKYLEETTPVSFDPNNLWSKSNATVHDMTVALSGTGLESVADVYIRAEKEWGVNAMFLVSLTAEESGWGTSDRAVYQNNLTGYAVYGADAEGEDFTSWSSSIMETAELICNEYLKETGRFHKGISIYNVNELYCPNDGGKWSSNISSIAYSLVEKINNR